MHVPCLVNASLSILSICLPIPLPSCRLFQPERHHGRCMPCQDAADVPWSRRVHCGLCARRRVRRRQLVRRRLPEQGAVLPLRRCGAQHWTRLLCSVDSPAQFRDHVHAPLQLSLFLLPCRLQQGKCDALNELGNGIACPAQCHRSSFCVRNHRLSAPFLYACRVTTAATAIVSSALRLHLRLCARGSLAGVVISRPCPSNAVQVP